MNPATDFYPRDYNKNVKKKIEDGKPWVYHFDLTKDPEVAIALFEHKQQTDQPYDKTILKALRQYLL